MFRHKMIAFILLTAVFMSGKAYCQAEIQGQPVSTVFGTVIYFDLAGSVLNVKTDDGTMLFYLSVESDLYQSSHRIASLEILKGDPVTIQYASLPSGKNIVTKLVDNRPYNN